MEIVLQRVQSQDINKDSIWQPIVNIDFNFEDMEDDGEEEFHFNNDAELLDFILEYGASPTDHNH